MIHIFTDNYFLQQGIISTLYPLYVEVVPIHEKDSGNYSRIMENDILLIDSSIQFGSIIDIMDGYFKNLRLIFLNKDSTNELNFRVLYSQSWIINSKVSPEDFRMGVVNVLTEKKRPLSLRRTLTPKERFILLESLKGMTVQDISKESGANIKTVYHQRKSACRKMGVKKVCEIVPYINAVQSKI